MAVFCILHSICPIALSASVVKGYLIIRRYEVTATEIRYNVDSPYNKLTFMLPPSHHSLYYCRESTHMISRSFHSFAQGDKKFIAR